MKQVAFSITEATKILGVSRSTVMRALNSGELKAARFASRTYRISAIELQRYWKERGGGELWPNDSIGIEIDTEKSSQS